MIVPLHLQQAPKHRLRLCERASKKKHVLIIMEIEHCNTIGKIASARGLANSNIKTTSIQLAELNSEDVQVNNLQCVFQFHLLD